MNPYALIKLLSDGKFRTGTELGQMLKVSRTAVWKQIQKINELSLGVVTDKQLGYRLEQPLDLLDEEYLAGQLSDKDLSFNWQLEVHSALDSTNSFLRKELSEHSKSPRVALAEMQTEGKGRRGRSWFSPFGTSISCSLACQYPAAAQSLQGLSLAVAVKLIESFAAIGVTGLSVKWPNDIYYQDKKLAGILIEVSGDLAGPCDLVVGFGINVYRQQQLLPDYVTHDLAYLADIATKQFSRTQLAAECTYRVASLLESYSESGFSPYVDAWNEHHAWQGLLVDVHEGARVSQVVLKQCNKQGELEAIDTSGKKRYLNAGEISLRKPV